MENQASEVPVSDWTQATGTRPFERYVYFLVNARHDSAQPAAPENPAPESSAPESSRA